MGIGNPLPYTFCHNDFKVALYVCPNYMNDDIHSDHVYLDNWDIYAGPP